MYALASKLASLPIISLQTGEAVAWTKQPLIDITKLEIIAFECNAPQHRRPLVLMAQDIRQVAADCLIVDSEDELSEPGDIVRLKSLLETKFSPLGKPVVAESGRKLGTVDDYSINLQTSLVQKLHVRQSLLRAWLGTSLAIDRTQIIDVTPHRIVVRDATIETPVMQPGTMPEARS